MTTATLEPATLPTVHLDDHPDGHSGGSGPDLHVPAPREPVPDALSHGLLSAADETSLAQRIEAGLYATHLLATGAHGDATVEELEWLAADGQRARDEFINSNLRLALSTARKFRGRGYTEEDVTQDAFHGLIKAVERFDYTKGFKFSTYAVWWIRESILTGIRASAFVEHPELLWNQMIKVRAIRLRLIDETGRQPTAEEIAVESARDAKGTPRRKALTVREVRRCLAEDRPITSLQTPIGEDDLTLGELVDDPDATEALSAIEATLDRERLHGLIASALSRLDESAAHVLVARYGLDGNPPRSLAVTAQELGLTRQVVRARERAALRALRHPMLASVLTEFRPAA